MLLESGNESLMFTMYTLYNCLADEKANFLPVNNSQREYCTSSDGDILLAGDSWKPNACTSCICNNGTIQCFSQRCPAARCKVPVLRKGQCCPQCLGKSILAWGVNCWLYGVYKKCNTITCTMLAYWNVNEQKSKRALWMTLLSLVAARVTIANLNHLGAHGF